MSKKAWAIEFYSKRGKLKETWLNEETKDEKEIDELVEKASEYRKENDWRSFKLKRK